MSTPHDLDKPEDLGRLNGLGRLNALDAAGVEEALLACCASPAWARKVATGRPYGDLAALLCAGDDALDEIGWPGVEEALAAHPRIGQRAAGSSREARWSRGEQAGVEHAAASVQDELTGVNQAYEQRFGHVFLICASGLSADHMLAEARRRLANPPAAERLETARELGAIVRLRLAKLVSP